MQKCRTILSENLCYPHWACQTDGQFLRPPEREGKYPAAWRPELALYQSKSAKKIHIFFNFLGWYVQSKLQSV